jgi:perosamine synthetase
MAVHLYGHSCQMDALCSLVKEHGIYLIEDCAEALGSEYHGKKVGAFGDIATFSFFGNKTVTTGEGGMVATNDETLHDRVVHFKGQGLAKHREYWHDVIGYNYRMTNICAAIGLAQLERVNETIARKRKIAGHYRELLKDLPVTCQGEQEGTFNTFWMFSILTSRAEQRDPLREFLKQAGIETRPLFYPAHTMPMYSQKFQKHPVAEGLGWRGINLPSFPELTEQDISFIVGKLKEGLEISSGVQVNQR